MSAPFRALPTGRVFIAHMGFDVDVISAGVYAAKHDELAKLEPCPERRRAFRDFASMCRAAICDARAAIARSHPQPPHLRAFA